MTKARKNLLIYIGMLALFGVLIYGTLTKGSRFSHLETVIPAAGGSAFGFFREMVTENLSHSLALLLIQIIVVLLTVRLFAWLCRLIGQPGVIGEIIAGIVLGPSLLGALFPDIFHFIFRPESLVNLELVSQLGLVLFMFVIGMEVDFKVLKNKINETLVISHAGILVPFFLGTLASYRIYEEYAASYTSFLPFALFMGISMSITAFPVLARIVQERNMTREPAGILSIASAANDDVTAWCLLAVVIAVTKAGSFAGALYVVGLTLVYIFVMFALVRPFLKRVGDVYINKEVINKTFVSFIFLVLVVSSTITEVLGIHALFGAFIAGVVMPPHSGFRKIMMDKVEDVALVFFLPLFFAYTGLRTEIGLINTPGLWLVFGLLVFVAVAGKLGGCWIAARLVGESRRDSYIIGTLMNTRGLMELVALNIGYEMGVLPPSIFVILVLMALVTTFMTTPLLSLEKILFRQPEEVESNKKKLVLSFGYSLTGVYLLRIYRLLYGDKLKAQQVIAAHYTVGTDLYPETAMQYYEESFVPVEEEARQMGIVLDKRYRVTNSLNNEIIRLSRQEDPDMLLLGAGPSFMISRKKKFFSVTSFFTLFRQKIEDIMAQVPVVVAIFVNRKYKEQGELFFFLKSRQDIFLLAYAEMMLENSSVSLNICYEADVANTVVSKGFSRINRSFSQRVKLHFLREPLVDHSLPESALLIVSYDTCRQLATDQAFFRSLPSLLVIRNKIE